MDLPCERERAKSYCHMWLLFMPPDRQGHEIEVHEIHRGEGVTGSSRFLLKTPLGFFGVKKGKFFPTKSRSEALHPNFEGELHGGGQGSPTSLTRGLATQRLFRVPPYREVTIHLQTSMPSPGFEPRPYDTAVSVASYNTE
ncbi:hypothetical protein TNCV_2657731 [Trichonephila clavipes]|nr:hypothetical protein TNCV_2657731 [Trichonephila clavipes]